MADERRQREIEAIRRQYAAIDFGAMEPTSVYASFVGDRPLHVLTADPAEFVRRSPHCADLTDGQRADVVMRLRDYLDDQSTGTHRASLLARIGTCADYLGRHVPRVRDMAGRERIPHETLLREIRGLREILDRMASAVRSDSILPTDPQGIEWVDVVTHYETDGEDVEIEARVYLDSAAEIVDASMTTLDEYGDLGKIVDPDQGLSGQHRSLWREAVREAAYERAADLGKRCAICGEVLLHECDCFADEPEKEAAHA